MFNPEPRWFIVQSGHYAGRPHLTGWMLSAIKGEKVSRRDDGWLTFATCPRCFAMVVADDKAAHGDQTWMHEQWHARTDFPIPADPGKGDVVMGDKGKDRFGDKPRVPPEQWYQGPVGGGSSSSSGCLMVVVGFVLAVAAVLW